MLYAYFQLHGGRGGWVIIPSPSVFRGQLYISSDYCSVGERGMYFLVCMHRVELYS